MSSLSTRWWAAAFCGIAVVLSAANVVEARRQGGGRRTPVSLRKRAARRQLRTIHKQIVAKQQVLRQTKRAQRRVSEQIRENQEGLYSARERLRQARRRLAVARRDLRACQQRLARAQERLKAHVQLLRSRLTDIYKHGTVSYAVALLEARDMWDLTSRGYMLERIVHHDARLLRQVKAERAEVMAETLRLRRRANEVAQYRAECEAQIQAVQERLCEQRQIQEDLRRDRVQLERALAELEENSREVEQMLRAFESQPDIGRRIPRPWLGSFLRPVGGGITSGFGMRFHPILRVTKLHTGVDFGARSGTPICAAGDGVVVHAGWWGGYGNCIVLAHGQGRSTLYGHCSSVSVSAGQQVRRGQVIGHVGSTGFSTGPHLHFEVRRNGVPVNPLSR